MEGEIIYIENIKPSSPTPHHKRTFRLSLLDQTIAPVFSPLVFYYYPNSKNWPNVVGTTQEVLINSPTIQILKKSLSETLTLFYPLAGRVSKDGGSLSIDCNDEGALFKVAAFRNNTLSDHLRSPDPIASRSHIPSEHTWTERGPGSHVAMFQASFFRCGGFAIGSLVLHSVADLATYASFLKAWAATGSLSLRPDYAARSLFPQNESLRRENTGHRRYCKNGTTVLRRYLFDGKAISRLRAEFQGRASRSELVSAVLWKCFMRVCAAARSGSGDRIPPSVVSQVVNLRGKAEPPFPVSSFGNLIWVVAASARNNSDADREFKHLVRKVRNAIRKVDADFVRRMQGDQGFLGYCENIQQSWNECPENGDFLYISSCNGFGLYSLDFGFGKPIWVSKCDAGGNTQWLTNVLWLMETKEGDGIEAWLILDEKYIAALDEIKELHDLAYVDPSPLDFIRLPSNITSKL